jgi:putative nucleotidyltransferase with HDIG domain
MLALVLNPEIKKILRTIHRFAKVKKVKVYLVGGYLRDIILKREKENPDIDFCLKKNAITFAKKLKKRIKAGFVVLDKTHGSCRLVKKIGRRIFTLDFTDFRGKTLEEDLLHRDFTINSFAVELESLFGKEKLENVFIDPYQGIKDLKSKVIRTLDNKSFDEDPLRILRAFSLAAIFGFKINNDTFKLIKLKRAKLSNVSSERIRDELFKILDCPDAFRYLLLLDDLKILKIIIPEIEIMRGVKQGPYHHLDVLRHTLETLRQFELLLPEFKNNLDLRNYLNCVISSGRRRLSLLKLGILLHDIGKPKARRHKDGKIIFQGHERISANISRNIAKRLRLSNDELAALDKMVFWHLRPGYLADNENVTARAKFRYFRDTAEEAVSTLLISLADQRATRGRLTTKESRLRHERLVTGLIKEYFRTKKEKKPTPLINGDDLIREFKLSPSPLIGKILAQVQELQAIGKLKTKKEALKLAQKIIGTSRLWRDSS